jgi:hypothetical protein
MAAFHLEIWRPVRLSRPVMYLDPGNPSERPDQTRSEQNSPVTFRFSTDHLYELVYDWSPNEDVWGGISEEGLRTQLRERVLSSFEPSLPPHARGLSALADVLSGLQEAAESAQAIGWIPSSQAIENEMDEGAVLWISPVLALLQQFTWIFETFRDVPDLSITLR